MITTRKQDDNTELVDMLEVLLMSSSWLLRKIWTLFLRLCKLRSPVLILVLSTLLSLNFYFILTLLSSQRSGPPKIHRYNNHGSNRLNVADRAMLGNDAYTYNHNDNNNGVEQLKVYTAEKYSNKCIILGRKSGSIRSNLKHETPFKIYIYDDMPAALNSHLSHCVTKSLSAACFRSDYCGFGPETGTNDNGLLIHGTWQFNLEVILHHKLLERFGCMFFIQLKRYVQI